MRGDGGSDRVRSLRPVSERPVEYLTRLEGLGQYGYESLLAKHDGSIALAAYELASVKNAVIGYHATPTSRDLRVAAKTIEGRIAWTGGLVPKARILAEECRCAGLDVLP